LKRSNLAGIGFAIFASTALIAPAEALTFNNSFNTTDINNNFGANAPSFMSALSAAESAFTSIFNDPVTINITFDASNIAGGYLGQTSAFISRHSWSAIQTAASADATSTADKTSVNPGGSLNGVAPSANLWITTANAKALGLAAASNASDGTITLNAAYNYFYGSSPVGGAYGMVGVMEHEISEVMGRLGLSGGSVNGNPGQYSLLDAFSYTAAGTRSLGNGAGNYFSIDDGATAGLSFNNASGGDTRDWASANLTNDAFNAFSSSGVINAFSATDITVMDVLGYNLTNPVPEPETYAMLLAGLGLLGFSARRRKQQRAS